MPNLWFTSDQHFGHRNVITYCNRPFGRFYNRWLKRVTDDAVREMNETIIQNWNAVVKDEDTGIFLGDIALGKNWVREIVPRLKGNIHLIAGNHDWCHPAAYKKETKREAMEKIYLDAGIKSICLEGFAQLGEFKCLLHHMPYRSSTSEDQRYNDFRPIRGDEDFLLHGHVHSEWKTKRRKINVGVDVWDFKPVHADELIALMTKIKNAGWE